MAPQTRRQLRAGITLVETLMAVALVVGFFVSIFELNGVCLRYINAAKTNLAALQGVQDRLEQLRDLSFADLTNAATVQGLMTNPSNGSDFVKAVTEVVTLSRYPISNGSNTSITRPPGASVTSTINSTDSNLGVDNPPNNAGLVKVNVTYTWTTPLGGRSATVQTETIISAGTKK